MSDQIKTVDGKDTDLVVAPSTTQPALVKMSQEDILAKIERAQKADLNEAPEAGIKYWEAIKGEEFRGVFLGFKTITPKEGERAGELIPAPVVQVSQYQAYMSAAVQLAGAFETVPQGAAVYVRCDDAPKGKSAQFTVKVLEA